MDLSTSFLNTRLENPFILSSAPPTATPERIMRAFQAGWAGAVIKTLTWEPVMNVSNRFAINKIGRNIFAFENIELLSEISPDKWFSGIKALKLRYPSRAVIGSIMADSKDKSQWVELALGCQDAGADIVELNFSCPHGYPEKGCGAAIGQHPEVASTITAWLKKEPQIQIPIVPKLTASVSDISFIGEMVAKAGADGLTAINTISSVMGFDLETLEPRPSVGGYSTPGGYSGPGIKPIALRCLYELQTSPGLQVMACGGISSGYDAAEFMLMGVPAVQVCTAVMLRGYGIIDQITGELREFMQSHKFLAINDFMGLGYKRMRRYAELDQNRRMKALLNSERCTGCSKCLVACQDSGYNAIMIEEGHCLIDQDKCQGCSLCCHVCPNGAIDMDPV